MAKAITKKTEVKTEVLQETKEVIQPVETKVEQVSNSNNELEMLKKQVEALQALLIANSKIATASQTTQVDDGYIRGDKNIQVMSLTPNLLNVSTEGNGKGKIFKFQKYGDVKNIIYSDLSNILLNNQSFSENGNFYIFDTDIVKRHGLESAYEKLLDKKAIDTFLDKNVEEIKEVFTKLPDAQKRAVIDSIVKKIVDGEDVSTNKVNTIKELYGEDVFKMADEMKNWEKEVEELSK